MAEPMKKPDSGGTQERGYIFPKKSSAAAPAIGGAFFRAGVIALHPVSGLLVGGVAGYFLWKHFDAAWMFWGLLLLGFAAGCLNARRDFKAMMRDGVDGNTARHDRERNGNNSAQKPPGR